MFRTLITFTTLSSVLACPEHNFNIRAADALGRRATAGGNDWNYKDPSIWGSIKPEYEICSTGTAQSPINLESGSFSTTHAPTFAYSAAVNGKLSNWGYGPSFALDNMNGKDITGNPSFTADGTTYYLASWHTHTPSEHLISGVSAKAELHLVHVNAAGSVAGVVGIPINVGAASIFFTPVIAATIPGLTSSSTVAMSALSVAAALSEGGDLKSYWTYKGSLTTPVCSEGLRWWVSGKTMTVSQAQMDGILAASDFSARGVQKIKSHNVGV